MNEGTETRKRDPRQLNYLKIYGSTEWKERKRTVKAHKAVHAARSEWVWRQFIICFLAIYYSWLKASPWDTRNRQHSYLFSALDIVSKGVDGKRLCCSYYPTKGVLFYFCWEKCCSMKLLNILWLTTRKRFWWKCTYYQKKILDGTGKEFNPIFCESLKGKAFLPGTCKPQDFEIWCHGSYSWQLFISLIYVLTA